MLKELKFLFYIFFIFLFFFLIVKFYFSDDNKKNSFRLFNNINKKNLIYSQNVILLKNDTNKIVEYVEKSIDENKKNYTFWNLLNNND